MSVDRDIGKSSSKMVTTVEQKPMDTYRFDVFYVLLESNSYRKFEIKSDLSIESDPSSEMSVDIFRHDL